jgi:hypothetical protein
MFCRGEWCIQQSSSIIMGTEDQPELIPVISGVRVFKFLDFCVVFCRSLFVLFRLAIVLSAQRNYDA